MHSGCTVSLFHLFFFDSSRKFHPYFTAAPVWRCNGNNDKIQSVANVKDDDIYNEINDFSVARKEVCSGEA